ncbi:NAD(P)H-binding protein [Flammeovirga pacifica]|uniref:NAD(P)-binding domain-containing protein n=1 Tax=Flammeovirga pacifica TaxID=915059 RepID=A0A1S1Z0B0_FLAPC|nr:NAD(P)H-binding protein [Flammeovirga pacifica]OHX66535.1 hypothetical protein NH26_09285 [Flammeovirga pacifica]
MGFSEIKTVSVIGAGWLGLPLIEKLLENGYQVKASTTTESKILKLRTMGVKAYNLNFSPTCADMDQLNDLLATDAVVICIPPRFRQHQLQAYHAEQIKVIKDAIESLPVNKVIYTSSTGVYENSNTEINENSPTSTSPKAKSILLAEEVLRINTDLDATILRLGGLMGYDRIPAKYVNGKKNLNYGDIPVNYVFRDDVIRAIISILDINDHNSWNKVFNLVAPEHPPKRLVYSESVKYGNFTLPTFDDPNSPPPFKIINSDKIKSKIGFEFSFPNPLDFKYDTLVD